MDSEITFDGSVATWVMPRTEGDLGGSYIGTFQFRAYLDPLRKIQAGREFRELLGTFGAQATDTEFELALALTQLKHRIIKAPPFWTSTKQESGIEGNIGDLNIVGLVFAAAQRAEKLFKDNVENERITTLEQAIKIGEEKLKKRIEEENPNVGGK